MATDTFDAVAAGIKIREIRESKKLKQKDIAEAIAIGQNYVSKIETGTRAGIETYANIAKFLDVPLGIILGEEAQQPSNARMLNVVPLHVFTTATAASCGVGNGLEYADFEVERMIYQDRNAFNKWNDSRLPFGIHIDGDSMVGAGLSEGSIAIVNPAEDVMDSDTALVSWKDNWFIKWVIYNIDGSVELRSANPNYQPIHIEKEYASNTDFFRVIGKVVSIIKTNAPKRAY